MGQTKLRDCAISRFVLLLILVFPPSLFKASQQTAASQRDRRSSMPCGKASQIFSFSVAWSCDVGGQEGNFINLYGSGVIF